MQQETAANAKPGEQGVGARAAPEVATAGPGRAAPEPLWAPGAPARPRIPWGAGEIGMGGGKRGITALERGCGAANTPCSSGVWGESGSSEPVTNAKSVLGEEGGGGGCSSVPECLFLRYLFISLSSGVMFELFSLSLDLSIISKIMKFPNVALSGCIPIPPSLFPILPAAPGTGVPGDVKTKTRGGAAADGGETGLCQPCQAPLMARGRGHSLSHLQDAPGSVPPGSGRRAARTSHRQGKGRGGGGSVVICVWNKICLITEIVSIASGCLWRGGG